jgi:hypothetical protein
VGDIDFFTDSFPQCDVITMGMILHDWGPEKKQLLVQKVEWGCVCHTGCLMCTTSLEQTMESLCLQDSPEQPGRLICRQRSSRFAVQLYCM